MNVPRTNNDPPRPVQHRRPYQAQHPHVAGLLSEPAGQLQDRLSSSEKPASHARVCGWSPQSGLGWSRSPPTCATASPRPTSTAGSARPPASRPAWTRPPESWSAWTGCATGTPQARSTSEFRSSLTIEPDVLVGSPALPPTRPRCLRNQIRQGGEEKTDRSAERGTSGSERDVARSTAALCQDACHETDDDTGQRPHQD